MIKWNEVTWYSRLGALILLLGVVPALCFYIGNQYAATKVALATQTSQVVSQPSIKNDITADANAKITFTDAKIEADLRHCFANLDEVPESAGVTTDQKEAYCESVALTGYQSIETAKYTALKNDIQAMLQTPDVQRSKTSELDVSHYYTDALQSLPVTEKAWESYRDNLCTIEEDFVTFGTYHAQAAELCSIELTKKHIQDLINADSGL